MVPAGEGRWTLPAFDEAREWFAPAAPAVAKSASEYFAVVSELHYSQPDLLRQAEPAIAELLEAFYGRSPADACESPAYCRSR